MFILGKVRKAVKKTKVSICTKKQSTLNKAILNKEDSPPKELSDQEVFSSYLGDGVIQQKNIKLGSFNVNGLRAIHNKGLLMKYIQEEQVDILVLNETKVDATVLRDTDLLDQYRQVFPYIFYSCCKPPLKGYSGVAIMTKFRPMAFHLDLDGHEKEGRLVMVEYDSFRVVGTYVPNSQQKLTRLDYRVNQWDTSLQTYLSSLKDKSLLLMGDLNVGHMPIDVHNHQKQTKSAGFTPQERDSFGRMLDSVGLVDSFRHLYPHTVAYSWWSYFAGARQKDLGWRIDYVLVSQCLLPRLLTSQIMKHSLGSDHCPVQVTLDLSPIQPTPNESPVQPTPDVSPVQPTP